MAFPNPNELQAKIDAADREAITSLLGVAEARIIEKWQGGDSTVNVPIPRNTSNRVIQSVIRELAKQEWSAQTDENRDESWLTIRAAKRIAGSSSGQAYSEGGPGPYG